MGRDYRTERIGQIKTNNQGCEMEILEYNNNSNIKIRFNDKYRHEVIASYKNFKSGSIKNPYHPNVYKIGFFGVGMHKGKIKGKHTKKYSTWRHILMRVNSPKFHKKNPTYRNCSICNEWHNFQVFGKWFDENFYTIGTELIETDKDILIKGNKLYSPETCVFVPKNINAMFTKNGIQRGDYPIGVSLRLDNNMYRAYCSNQLINLNKKTRVDLGQFPTPELAFNSYKKYKENHIKEVADYYKNSIPQKLYDALYRYEVEITD